MTMEINTEVEALRVGVSNNKYGIEGLWCINEVSSHGVSLWKGIRSLRPGFLSKTTTVGNGRNTSSGDTWFGHGPLKAYFQIYFGH